MATINGTAGDDVLTGTDDADIINGLDGNDIIDGGFGADTLNGGAGNDTFRFSSVRYSTVDYGLGLIDGGSGYDTIDWSSITPVVLGVIQNNANQYVLGAYVGSQKFEIRGVERVLMGNSNDTFLGSSSTTGLEVHLGGGADDASFYGGNKVYGEGGDDRLFISGFGGAGVADGGEGYDTLVTNIGFTVDLAAGTAKSFDATFEVRNFEVLEMNLNGYASYGYGDDSANVMRASKILDDGSAGLTFDGRGGDDYISGGNGNDTLIGGTGIDTVSYEYASAGVRVDLTNGLATGGAGRDTLSGFEIVVGSAFSDELIGDRFANVLKGGAGDDTFAQVAGSGRLRPQGGNDVFEGGDGTDTAFISGVRADYQVLTKGNNTYLIANGNAVQLNGIEKIAFAGSAEASIASATSSLKAFDSLSYVASYADLRAAFGTDSARGEQHFVDAGFNEGRQVSFNALNYIASYQDLRSVLGADASAGARHFISYGANEGRTATFNAWSYLASYADLISTFGGNAEAAARHYITYGANEGRAVSFNAAAYAQANPDLVAVLGNDAETLARHYVLYGFAEGRNTGTSAASHAETLDAISTSSEAAPAHAFASDDHAQSDLASVFWHGGEGHLVELTVNQLVV